MPQDELAGKLDEVEAEIKELSLSIRANDVVPLVAVITTKGKLKGELSHLTVKQYQKFFGTMPRPAIVKDGKIPWHLALDQLATEKGFRSDEALKEAIEKARDDVDKLVKLKLDRRVLMGELKEKITSPVKVEKTKLEGDAPVFPTDEATKREVAEINGVEVNSRRNPSFWQVEVDKLDTEKKPDTTLRVRYAKDKDKLVRAVTKDAEQAKEKERISPLLRKKLHITGRKRPISPRVPKLR